VRYRTVDPPGRQKFPVAGVTRGGGGRWAWCRRAERGDGSGRCPVGRGVAAGHRA